MTPLVRSLEDLEGPRRPRCLRYLYGEREEASRSGRGGEGQSEMEGHGEEEGTDGGKLREMGGDEEQKGTDGKGQRRGVTEAENHPSN